MSKKNTTTTTSGMNWNEMLGLLHHLKKDNLNREYLLIACGCYLGLRASDLLNLKWADVLNKDSITLIEKKTGKTRLLTINPNLKDIINYCYGQIIKNKTSKIPEFLFPNRISGNRITIQYLNRMLHNILKKYNIKVSNSSSHLLRKTFGHRIWLMDNQSERALIYLSQIFNHSNVSITRRYIGIVQEDITNIYLNL